MTPARRPSRVGWVGRTPLPALRRVSAIALGLLLVTAATASPPPERQRVIIRLADGTARVRLLADARTAGVSLDVRHERVVRGLRAIHAASLSAARAPLAEAKGAGALREIDRLWIVNAVVAEVDAEWIARLEADPAVLEVVPDRRLVLHASGAPDRAAPAGPLAGREGFVPVEELVRIRVPEVWAQGITGQGAIVANVDTGVNGDDDTMGDRWRGRFAGSDAAWYAPVTLTVFPEDDGSLFGLGHGTGTMGIMTGGEADFGVAFDATWIAGDTFEQDDGFVSNALKIFEWLTDPDGDPSTRSDVPDVVNNSYGLETLDTDGAVRCDPIFDRAIDALEAAGAIVIWSAGNLGTAGITAPASRADSPVNAFAVGGITASDDPVASSGRGPSTCGGSFATKPEIVAPGQSITSRTRFNQTSSAFTGTSFSTPMVGGVLALMRSKNPTITPEAAKTILLETARDLGEGGDDNDTGEGLVDAAAAIARVDRPSQPLARLIGFEAPPRVPPAGGIEPLVLRPGGTHDLDPVFVNHGPAIPGSSAILSSPTPGVTVADPAANLPPAATGETFRPQGGDGFLVNVAGTVEPGSDIVLDLVVQGAGIGPFRIVLKAGDPIAGDFATHDAGPITVSVTNFGALGYYTGIHGAGPVLQGAGFRFPEASPNWLFHAGFIAGTGPDRLSDAIPYGEDTQNATDWIPLAGFPILTDAAAGGQRITSAYDDRRAIAPLGLEVRQESFTFDDPAESFVLLQYIVTNTTAQTIGGLRVGLFADWDLTGSTFQAGAETGGWDVVRRLGFAEPGAGAAAGAPRLGLVWLDDTPTAQVTFAVLRKDDIVESALGNPSGGRAPVPAVAPDLFGGEFSDAEKWQALTSGQSQTTESDPQDLWFLIGAGPKTLVAGATDTAAVALVAAADLATLRTVAEAARAAYFERVLGTTPPPPPPPTEALALDQNFPNPFRVGSSTTIPLAVPGDPAGPAVAASLVVYDLAGRRVRTLIDGEVVAGEQAAAWDGRDERGRSAPSGVYVAQLVVAGEDRSIRLLLVR